MKNIKVFEKKEQFFEKIKKEVENYKLSMFAYEPKLIKKEKNTEYISLADNDKYDNCEMFLLPDGCFCDERTNNVPFIERMNIIKKIIITIQHLVQNFEIFMGECAANQEDFITVDCSLEEFPSLAQKMYYSEKNSMINDLHIIITDTLN
jgi:hypothetical protein